MVCAALEIYLNKDLLEEKNIIYNIIKKHFIVIKYILLIESFKFFIDKKIICYKIE